MVSISQLKQAPCAHANMTGVCLNSNGITSGHHGNYLMLMTQPLLTKVPETNAGTQFDTQIRLFTTAAYRSQHSIQIVPVSRKYDILIHFNSETHARQAQLTQLGMAYGRVDCK